MYCFPTESAPEVASATSCTWNPYHGNFVGSCMAAAGKGIDVRFKIYISGSIFKCISDFLYLNESLLFSHQTPLSFAFPGTTLPLQGSTKGPWEAEVEGPRTLWKILKEAKLTRSPTKSIPLNPSSEDKVIFFFFLVNCWKCFSFIPFLRWACVAFSIKQICNSALAPFAYLNISLFII